jgi:predicted CoA-binding protein
MPAKAAGEIVAVLGASPKPDRYAYRAMQKLRAQGYRPVPVNPAFAEILGEKCFPSVLQVPEKIDTVTVYLRKARSALLVDDLVRAKPRRIILNPGAENDALTAKARVAGIEVVEGCTLVMLGAGTF